MPGHTLKVTLDRDVIALAVKCHEPDGAFCRKACSECEDGYCVDPANYIKPIDYCLAAEWLDADNAHAECYEGAPDKISLSDGMGVDVRWDGFAEHWEWKASGVLWRAEPEIAEPVAQ